MVGRSPLRHQSRRSFTWLFRWLLASTLLTIIALSSVARAEKVPALVAGGPDVQVPKELMPWVPWVTSSITEGLCPKIGDQEQCVWPASLEMDVSGSGATFAFDVYVDFESWVFLPGDESVWPEEIRTDGKASVVLAREGTPATRLLRGSHRIEGRFLWQKAPETLMLPGNIGIVKLRVRGQVIPFPRREDNGALWLQAGTADEQVESERIDLEVFRRLDDAIPLRVETQIVLRVAGKNRELRLTGPVLPGARTLSLESNLAVRFEPNNELVLQVTAGEHRVTLKSLYPTPPERIELSKSVAPWPDHETWVFVADNALRQVVISGAPNVDAAQTNLPKDWKSYPAFAVSSPEVVTFETKRRGEPSPPPNQLNLQRQWWLGFDGRGYTVQDHITGTLNRDFRLDLAPYVLGHAATKGQDLLVTRSPEGAYGVELRESNVDLNAEWRFDGGLRELPAIGWRTDVASLSATLNLPPGWDILHVTGVDSTSDTWWSRWSLWGFFYVLIVAIAVARLLDVRYGLLALLTLILIYEREGAPMALWAVLLVLFALLRLVPEGWFRSGLRLIWLGTAIVFAAFTAQFSFGEVRGAFFPTTRPPYGADQELDVVGLLGKASGGAVMRQESAESVPEPAAEEQAVAVQQFMKTDNAVAPPPKAPVAQQAMNAPFGGGLAALSDGPGPEGKKGSASYSKMAGVSNVKRQRSYASQTQMNDPDAVVQTGPGLPSWRWKTVEMKWSGPVQRDQRIFLYLLSPLFTTLFGCLRVVGVLFLGFTLIRRTHFGKAPPGNGFRFKVGKLATAAVTGGVILLFPYVARAEITQELLTELKTRLMKAPDCETCIEVESLELSVAKSNLETRAIVHAGTVSTYRVPGPVRSWVPESVLVDGKASNAMALAEDGFLHVRLTPGTHSVRTSGRVPGLEWVITPGSNSHRVIVNTTGYTVDGLRDGRVEGSLHFTATDQPKEKDGNSVDSAASQRQFPPWLEISRTLELGVVWTITTEVTRRSPVGQPVSLRYPLLPDEEITETGALVEQRQLVVSLGRDDETVSYRSVLKPGAEIALMAATDKPWTEHWQVRCATLWHCTFDGIAPYDKTDQLGYAPKFRPWPGEKLKVSVVKPAAAPGATRTIERVTARFTPGQRLLRGQLEFVAKVSKSGAMTVRLETGAVIQKLSIDEHDEPIRSHGALIEFSLQPGRHLVKLEWHEPSPLKVWFKTPTVILDGAAVNAKVVVQLPSDRWLLFTYGPSWGPKVLLWSYVLLLVAAAWVLVRIPKNPLRVWQWVLLALGLTQVPIALAIIVVAWFFLMAYRGAFDIVSRKGKKATQVVLALYTLVFLGCLCGAVYDGLVSNPDMHVSGADTSDALALSWFVDRIQSALPSPVVLSLPVVAFRVLNLFWALWLAASLVGWLRWGWEQYCNGGLWVPKIIKPNPVTPSPVEPNPLPNSPSSNP